MPRYDYKPFDYAPPPELGGKGEAPECYAVAIIGAGPIGLALAIDLAMKGVKSVVLDDNNVVSLGSRAICWAKRTLEIFHRLGVGERMLEKGVTWKVGRLFHGSSEVYSFDLLPEAGHKYPAFINLQQYYVEEYLVDRCRDFPEHIDLRFKNKVTDHADKGDHVTLSVETPDGNYTLDAQYMVACDGARSQTRQRMALAFEGQTFQEKFLIADVEMDESPFGSEVTERWFWFEPDFHQGNSTLLHKQPDNIYRIDFQLQPDADEAEEKKPETLDRRLRAMIGDKPYKLDWMSIYRFTCARLDTFVHNRVIFCGDSAHTVSPFGARGGNGGIQDADNLGWRLAAVLHGNADGGLLARYGQEREYACDENIRNSAQATNFMTPKSPVERMFREEVLRLAKKHEFARKLINSGRLSMPAVLSDFAGNTQAQNAKLANGTPFIDAPLMRGKDRVYLSDLLGDAFTLLSIGEQPDLTETGLQQIAINAEGFSDDARLVEARYGNNITYLIRPDGHVAASFTSPDAAAILQNVRETLEPPQPALAAE